MIVRVLHILIIVLLATLQITLPLALDWLTPQLVLAAILAFTLAGDVLDSIVWVVVGGLILDLVASPIPGLYLVFFGIIGLFLLSVSQRFLRRPIWPIALLVFYGVALLADLILSYFFGQLTVRVLATAGSTALTATLIYYVMMAVGRRREVIHLG